MKSNAGEENGVRSDVVVVLVVVLVLVFGFDEKLQFEKVDESWFWGLRP